MKNFLWLLLLLSSPAFAQLTQFVTQQQFATRAAVTLYVDPTGNDSNQCIAAGASACLTLNGAINKVPKRVRHNVTINVAAGTYAGTTTISDLYLSTEVSSFITFTIASTLTAFAPTTGTASGTLTGSAAVASGGYVQRVTDSGQSWTVNNLKGRFFTVGGISRPIISNTATTIDVVRPAAFAAGNTYTIDTPAASLTGSVTVRGLVGASNAVALTNLDITGTLSLRETGPSAVTCTNCRVTGTVTASLKTKVNFTRGFSIATTQSAFSCLAESICAFNESYFVTAATALGTAGLNVNGGSTIIPWPFVAENTSATGHAAVVYPNRYHSVDLPLRGRFVCASGSSGSGVHVSPTAVAGYDVTLGPIRFQNQFSAAPYALEIEECATGFKGFGDVWLANASSAATTWYFNNVTTAFDLGYGARAILGPGSTFTFTSVVNQFRLDGTVYTLANLDAASPQVLTTPYFTLLAR